MSHNFERLIDPTRTSVETPPPQGLLAFFRHYARQVRGPIAGLFLGGLFVALLDASIPICIGRVAGLVATVPPGDLLRDQWPQLAVMGLIVLVLRPCIVATQAMLVNQATNPGFSNLIRWQSYWNVVRQSWTFFQNDFAGRIANRVLQTGLALREVMVIAIAHQLSTSARMDRLLFLDQGRIVEQGTHADLLARGGAHARAWTRQSLGFEAAV